MPRELGDLLTLKELQEALAAWRDENFPDATAEDQFFGVVEELGELAHAYHKSKFGIRGFEKGVVSGEEMDAVGDIILFLLGYCSKRGISAQDSIEYAWAQVKNRDWKANPETGRPWDDDHCPKSQNADGSHCNHADTHDKCDWCGASWGEGGVMTKPEPTT